MSTHKRLIETLTTTPNTGPEMKVEREGDLVTVHVMKKSGSWRQAFSISVADFGVLYAFAATGQEIPAFTNTKYIDGQRLAEDVRALVESARF